MRSESLRVLTQQRGAYTELEIRGFHHTRGTIALCVKAMAVFFATIAIYHQDLAIVANESLGNLLMSYTLLIPFLLIYTLYRKRKMLRAVITFEPTSRLRKPTYTNEIVGALLCVTALLVYWHGSFTFNSLEYHMASMPLFVAGGVLLIFNAETLKTLAFPILLLLFLVPLTEILGSFGNALSTHSAGAVYSILNALSLRVTPTTVYLTPALIIQRPDGTASTLIVNKACSGINSMLAFAIFAIFAAYIVKGAVWKKYLMLLMGFPLIYVLNILRIVALALIEYYFEIDTASQVFHVFGGWILFFSGTLLLLFLSQKILKIHLLSKTESCPECSHSSEQTYGFCFTCGKILGNVHHKISKRSLNKIIALLLSATLIAYSQLPVFASRRVPSKVDFQHLNGEEFGGRILPEMQDYTLRFIYRDPEFEEIAEQDASLVYAYLPKEASGKMVLTTLEISKSQSSLHGWEVCLVTWPEAHGNPVYVEQLDLRDVQLVQNPPVVAKLFTFRYVGGDTVQTILWWREYTFFDTGTTFEREFVKISLVAYSNSSEDFSETRSLLLPFGQAIANYWQPTKTWSPTIITVAEHGKTLIAVTATFIIVPMAVAAVENRREKRRNLVAYNKLSSGEDKDIIKAVHREKKATLKTIASAYRDIAGKKIQLEQLLEKLKEAEKADLLERRIISRNEEPTLVWKSNMPRTVEDNHRKTSSKIL